MQFYWLFVAGCLMSASAEAEDWRSGSWRLVALDGAEFPATATLEFVNETAVRGQAPCNSWSARGAGEDGALFGPILSTKMACEHLRDEIAFFEALSEVTTAEHHEDRLVLSGEGRELVFVAAAK